MQTPRFLKAAVVAHPTLFGGLRIDVGHIALTLLAVFGGGVAGYFESQPTTTIIQALQSWSTAKPLLLGALVVGGTALIAQAKKSYLTWQTKNAPTVVVPPAPPAMTVIALFCFVLGAAGCSNSVKNANAANDLTSLGACVENEVINLHVTDAIAVITACGPEEGAAILAELDAIFASPSLSARVPPAQLAALKTSRHAAAAQYPPAAQ